MTRAITLALAAGSLAGQANAQQAFSPAWFANKGAAQSTATATGRLPNGQPALPQYNPGQQQQQARDKLQASIGNLNLAARAIAAQQSAQAAARAAAIAAGSTIPEGLGEGGLKVDTNSLTAGWHNAKNPTQNVADGKTTVTIEQTADKAILNWETFNVGRNTTVKFDQDASWSALNRVNDPNARPSEIQGTIEAPGTVLIVNRNGIVFDGSAQVNVRNLAAAAANITDAQFGKGLYSEAQGSNFIPTFANNLSTTANSFTHGAATGEVVVKQGARIATHVPGSVTEGGGYVLLAGAEVHNAGEIVTHNGQTTLAAGDAFVIKKGLATDANQHSTTRGNVTSALRLAESAAGKVGNSGLIRAETGDISLVGHAIRQDGTLLATTSVHTRGTIHLSNDKADATGTVTLGKDSATVIALDDSATTALDVQRETLIKDTDKEGDGVKHRRDQSLVQIVSGGSVDFEGDSLTLATGGQVLVDAVGTSTVQEKARIDVSGHVGVKIAMEANNVLINVQGNEQRDAPVNRDGDDLRNNDIWLDRRDLVLVPAGTNGYETDRWYTAGGLLEVGGYLGITGHGIGEWSAQGGTVQFSGAELITQQGSNINLSGGTLDVLTGHVYQTWLKGADGQLYNASTAPGDLLYTGLYKGFETAHTRWGSTVKQSFYNPLIAPLQRLENGYTVGRDAGKLVVSTQQATLQGDLDTTTFQGERQQRARDTALDGYQQAQTAVARNGQLIIGTHTPVYDKDTQGLRYTPGAVTERVVIGDGAALENGIGLDAAWLNALNLGGLKVYAQGGVAVNEAITVAPGGELALHATQVDVNADLTARGGSIAIGDLPLRHTTNGGGAWVRAPFVADPLSGYEARTVIGENVTLDARGMWSNLKLDATDIAGLPYIDGGEVDVRGSGDVMVGAGALLDTSSGAALMADDSLNGGRGGDVALVAGGYDHADGSLVVEGLVRGLGVKGGGRLTVGTGTALSIGGEMPAGSGDEAAPTVIDAALFASGFADYRLTGQGGVAIADGAQIALTMPVLRFDPAVGGGVATGADPAQALAAWLPPLAIDDPAKARLTRRGGASLELNAGSPYATGALHAGAGSRVEVDPGQAIVMHGNGQITLNGEFHARGGRIAVLEGARPAGSVDERIAGIPDPRSLWLGEGAVMDVSGVAFTGADASGRRYGEVLEGGRIELGTEYGGEHGTTGTTFEGFLILRPGARLEASGAAAELDVAGQAVRVSSDGGAIALGSTRSLFVDGALRAEAGGEGAAGGVLALRLETPNYGPVHNTTKLGENVDDAVRVPRELVLSMWQGDSGLAAGLEAAQMDDSLVYGAARLGVDRIEAGGFGGLALNINGILGFDGDMALHLPQRLSLTASVIAIARDGAENGRVTLSAPYVRLAGKNAVMADGAILPNPYTSSSSGGAGDLGVPLVGAGSRLEVRGALIDVTGDLALGARGSIIHNSGTPLVVERWAFDDVLLASSGDLRFIGADTGLYSPGNLTLEAAQLYPTTGASATVLAGQTSHVNEWGTISRTLDPQRRLTVRGTGAAPAALPYSVFGSLSLNAANLDQGGVIRAPLGSIRLGAGGTGLDGAGGLVNLLPGSITSVSAAGLVMPYGGTVDGLSYTYDGQDVIYQGVGNEPAVTLAGRVHVQDGAVIDLSGGGELTGAGFLTGRGGSTDARLHPLVQMGGDGGFVLPGLGTNPVYAIVPGAQPGAAPVVAEKGAGDPAIGRQITIGHGVPGLPAGTYTLLPSTFALLPGAFRVELNGLASSTAAFGDTTAMRNGSYSTAARLGIAGTGVADALTTQAVLTAAGTLRAYSQYNETSYAQFALAQAEREGIARAVLERDAKRLQLNLAIAAAGDASPALRIEGEVRNAIAERGRGSVVNVTGGMSGQDSIEILADGAVRTEGFDGASVHASQINAVGAARIMIGGTATATYSDRDGSLLSANVVKLSSNARDVILRAGSELEAAEVFLVSGRANGGITVEQGASIDTLGRGAAAWDSREGFIIRPGTSGVLAVSNGWLEVMAPDLPTDYNGAGRIDIGVCAAGAACTGETRLYSEGTITAATDQAFNLGESVRYGARNLVLAVGGINVGGAEALAEAAAAGFLPAGLTLNQPVLDRLLRGDTSTGAPALENLVLTARDSVNFYGTVDLSTLDPATGASTLERLVLGAPAIYGHGEDGDVARIETDTLVWNGAFTPAGAFAGAAGEGQFVVDARRIEFGYGPSTQPDSIETHDRLTLGFAAVNLNASERITANHKGALAVYQQGTWDAAANTWTYSGGDLNISTPLLTGHAGSVNEITAGGNITLSAPAGSTSPLPDNATLADALGATLSFDAGRNLNLDTAVLLPSGKLTLAAQGDVTLEDGAQLDLAGRKIDFFDVSKYSWGGDVILDSRGGDVLQHADSNIDLSAQYNRAGKLTALALDGSVDLRGGIEGGTSGHYDAGGTLVPFAAGSVDVRGRHIADFTGLNARLTEGEVFGGRSFQLKEGDLVIGDELKAREINVSVDNGSLTVTGTVDASGEQAGSIRLAANNGVTLTGTAMLDASASVLRKDSYGQVIEAPNRAVIELDSGEGLLAIATGARMNMRVDGATQNYGTVALNAPRLGSATGNDINIDVSGTVDIAGAKSIAVNAFHRYDDAALGTDPTADGRSYQVIDQDYLDDKHDDSMAFIDNALANGALMDGKLAGLRAYNDQFHLRPGVEIVSDAAINPDGDLHIDGDIDLSRYRYASVNPHTQKTGVYGSGEAGALVLRAAGNLDVFGSITDGFDGSKLGASPDDGGWVLPADVILWGGDVVVPHGGRVTLAAGTTFVAGRVLNYDLPIQAPTLPTNTLLPVEATLTAAFTLPAGTVLGGAIHDDQGNLLHAAGGVLAEALTLQPGARLGAGLRLPGAAAVAALTWPAGVPLPFSKPIQGDFVTLASDITLPKGAVIPSQTVVKLPGGATSVDLRPADADGAQGRLWALAPMLPEGSLSWDIRLVAGADTDAADRRALAVRQPADIRLADVHYGVTLDRVVVEVPGTGSPAVYSWADDVDAAGWTDFLSGFFGLMFTIVPGQPIAEEDVALIIGMAGSLQDMDALGAVFAGLTTPLTALTSPATPPETEVDWAQGPGAREVSFSVLRTGTGDLELLSSGDFHMTSLYGVYTAGTPSASLGAGYDLARGRLADGSILTTDYAGYFDHLVDGGADSLYHAWYPEAGGNLLLRANGDVTGNTVGRGSNGLLSWGNDRSGRDSSAVGNWLWRQGSGSVNAGGDGVPTAWWINFGTYIAGTRGFDPRTGQPYLTGFTGIGTLGGGNLTVEAGGDAGLLAPLNDFRAVTANRSQGLNLVVAGTGRVGADGTLVQTGGGDLALRVGGGFNPRQAASSAPTASVHRRDANTDYRLDKPSTLPGALVNLRGALNMAAGQVGSIELRYDRTDPEDSRTSQPWQATSSIASGGPVLVLGDAVARIDSRGDLVLTGVSDATRLAQPHNGSPFAYGGASYDGLGYSWFSLWTPSTAVDLFTAGGNLTPAQGWAAAGHNGNAAATDGRFIYPSVLRAVAANGSLYYGNASLGTIDPASGIIQSTLGVTLAPSPVATHFTATGQGELELLAKKSLYAAGYAITRSGADPTALPNPFDPAFVGITAPDVPVTNVSLDALAPTAVLSANDGLRGEQQAWPLFSFTSPSLSAHAVSGQPPARYYAVEGDVIGLRTGSMIYRGRGSLNGVAGDRSTWYEAGGTVAIRAGRDIVNSGTLLGEYENWRGVNGTLGWSHGAWRPEPVIGGSQRGNLIAHRNVDDVSVVEAGRDIRYSSFYVTGPGLLELSAGRDVYMADKAELKSLGPVVNVTPGDRSSGAGIAVMAGLGDGARWDDFAARYLDPANQADLELPFGDQPGTALYVYGGELTLARWLQREFDYQGDEADAEVFLQQKQSELDAVRSAALAEGRSAANRSLAREYKLEGQLHLVNWLSGRFGGRNGLGLHFDAATMDARRFFDALPPEQRRAYLRDIYYAELKASGREYNDADGPRSGSYLRGREAIATLFPEHDADGNELVYEGGVTQFSSPQYITMNIGGRTTKRPQPGVNYLTYDEWVALGQNPYTAYYQVLDAGIHTDFGGDISILAPGGQILVGIDGAFTPGPDSGLLTQGEGDISLYARDSILIGQSRIFTTFGGNILGWSAAGDINAGRGAKTTVVYTPQRRVYDAVGNVSLAPSTPNTGAGIATLNPIPEVPPGDIDLIAPLGTIDAGEAGIRVSGNVNLAALQVVNAENIQVQGEATGIPVVAAVNVGALTDASAAASSAAAAASDMVQRDRADARRNLPSVFTVRVLGFGDESPPPARRQGVSLPPKSGGAGYDMSSMVQVVGLGTDLEPEQAARLTDAERERLRRDR